MLQRSLALRLSAAFLTLSLGTVLLATFVSYRDAETALRDRLTEQLEALTLEHAAQLGDWHLRQQAALKIIARSAGTRAAALAPEGGPTGSRSIALIDPTLFAATELMLLSVPGGRVIRASHPRLLDTYAVDQLYYQAARERSFTQTVYPSGTTGRPTMTVATPVLSADGATIAVLAAHLDLTHMQRVIDRRPGKVPMDAYVVNRFAEFVSAERFGSAEFRRGVHSAGIDSALAGGSGAGSYVDYRGRPVVGAWRWLPALELALVLESPQDAAFAPARQLLRNALLTGLFAALLLTFGVLAISRRVMRPVLAVTATAEAVARGDFSATAPVEGVDEIGRLATVFNEMTRRLEANRALLQDVVDNSTTIIVVVDLEHRILLANRRFQAAVEHSSDSLVGATICETLPEPVARPIAEMFARTRRDGSQSEIEITLGTEADPHTWQAVAFPLHGRDGAVYAFGLVATDLTERARAEQERRHRDASVQQAQKLESLGIMAGGIAHDFNNILSAVLGNVDLARTALDDPNEVRIALEQIGAATRRAAELTRQMLAYAGRASLRNEATDLRPVLYDMVALVRAAHSKKVTIDVGTMDAALWVGIDPAQLSQVALNLLTNAAEAIGDQEGTITLRAGRGTPSVATAPSSPSEPGSAPLHGWIHIQVTDTGSGISEEVRRRIFDPFFSTKAVGRGLGLSAVTGIIRSTGGVIDVQSVPGRETTFDVYLPAVAAPESAEGPSVSRPIGQREGTILVVDDEWALRRICRRTLEPVGYTVLEAEDGIAGLEAFRAHGGAVDLVVLDLTMPRMGGAELLSILRAERPDLPVVIASGYDRAERHRDLPNDANTRFLQKPFATTALLASVTSLLD